MSDIRWEGYSHEEIYAAVHQGPGQSISAGAEAAWAATEALILRIDERIAVAMAQSVGGWEGRAAEAGRTAMTPLGQWALDAANDAKITAQAVARQGEQARDLRNAMPEPNSAQLDAEYDAAFTDPTYLFHGRDDLQAAEQESANRAARAVDLMNGYTNNSYENRRHMDYWTLPPQVTVETTAPAAAPPGGPVPAGAGGFGEGSASPGGAAGVAAAGAPPGVAGAGTSVPAPGPIAPPGPGVAAAGGGGGSGPPPVVLGAGPAGIGAGMRTGGAPAGADRGGSGASSASGAAAPGPTIAGGSGIGARGSGNGGPGARPGVGGVRPVVPGPPARGGTVPSWRDLVPQQPGRDGGATGSWPRTDEERRLPPPGGNRAAGESRAPGGERPAATEPAPRGAAARVATTAQPGMYPPLTAASAGRADEERRRPDYLVDDGDAFADDRWFTAAVIGADDPLPPR
ncbi:hypothetical protein [Pseudonocardia xinjiangensis]|uniref:hypothetical protein n=1 Tax=Pseudonocardia xinjiangensis TaxID=75289 RepID=UPI0031DA3D79